MRILQAALARGQRGEYQIQATVAALHDDARTAEETDWPQILAWYDELIELTDNPVAALSRAVAVGEVDGPLAGLSAVEELAARLGDHHRLDAVRARLHERAGHFDIAAEHYTRAAARARSTAERDYLANKRPDCAAGDRDGFRDSAGHGVRVVTLVDGVHQNLAGFVEDFVTEPTTMPWGNRSLLFRDPDGNLVNFFTSVTMAAIEKFAR